MPFSLKYVLFLPTWLLPPLPFRSQQKQDALPLSLVPHTRLSVPSLAFLALSLYPVILRLLGMVSLCPWYRAGRQCS